MNVIATSQRDQISIVTPSLNMLGYLKRCAASIADQKNVSVEHIVIDGGSRDGTREWLYEHSAITSVCEKDTGMYDAINKGLRLARSEILACLNCDEQYLPGALESVCSYFASHPDVDILFGQHLLIVPDGSLVAFRKTFPPRWFYFASSHLYAYSCATFFRRRIVDDGFCFDTGFDAASDLDFVVRILRHGYRSGYARKYLAAFTVTGHNKTTSPQASGEYCHFRRTNPLWVRALHIPLHIARYTERLLGGAYWEQMPLEYTVYVNEDARERTRFHVSHARFRASINMKITP